MHAVKRRFDDCPICENRGLICVGDDDQEPNEEWHWSRKRHPPSSAKRRRANRQQCTRYGGGNSDPECDVQTPKTSAFSVY